VSEGLSALEVAEHQKRHKEVAEEQGHVAPSGRARAIQIVEALLLAVVTIAAAWCGFAAAQYGTDSRIAFAEAGQLRTDADSLLLTALEVQNLNQSTFNSWWTAYLLDDEAGMAFARETFRPELQEAFDEWFSGGGVENPNADSPFDLESYERPVVELGQEKMAEADRLQAEGIEQGITGDKYVRITVFLAGILFLVGISSQFTIRRVRYALITVSGVMLVVSISQMLILPNPLF